MANVAAGSYSITAKTTTVTAINSQTETATCSLVAGGTTLDTASFTGTAQNDASVLVLVGTVTFGSTSSILLRCRTTLAPTDVRMSRIVAVKVDSIQRDAVTG
jgi:hypothetical protein